MCRGNNTAQNKYLFVWPTETCSGAGCMSVGACDIYVYKLFPLYTRIMWDNYLKKELQKQDILNASKIRRI